MSSHHGSWEWSGWYHAKYDYPGVSEYWKCVDDYNTYYPGPEVNFFQKLVVESDYDIAAYTYYGDTELSTPGCIRYSDAWPRYRAAGSTRLVDGYNLQFQRTVTSHNSKWLPCDVYKDIHAETTRRYYFPDSITSGYYYYALVRIIYSPDGPTNWTELCNDTSSSVKHKWVVLSLDILGDAPYAYDWRWIGWWAWHPTAE